MQRAARQPLDWRARAAMSAPDDACAAACEPAACGDAFAALPLPLLLKIFAALPVDTRLRCAEVCKTWRSALAERSLWIRLDLSDTSGVTHGEMPALLRAAAAKAGGGLSALDVSGVWQWLVRDDTLREELAANAGALRELRCLQGRKQSWATVPDLEALLSAAPQLRVCEADLLFTNAAADARRALRNEGVLGPLRMHTFQLDRLVNTDAATRVSLFADVAAHASLTELHLKGVSLRVPEVFGAFVDAALSIPLLRAVTLDGCRLSPASAPALARLLGSGTLTELVIYNSGHALLDAPAAALLGAALRANATLTSLMLFGTQLWGNHAAAATLLGALTGHCRLRELSIIVDVPAVRRSEEDQLHACALLGALVAANAPALTELDVSFCGLRDAGLRQLFEALPSNTHLRTLDCSYNGVSEPFAADVLLPAVRANTSLRHFAIDGGGTATRAAELLVARRTE
jgi:hypothetical protein